MILMAGCQSIPNEQRWTAISGPERIEGRLSITGVRTNPSFSLERLSPDRQIFRAFGTMGLGEVSVLYDKGEPVEGRFEGKRLSAEQMQETLRLKTGLEVPLAVLPAWIQGRADSRWDSRGSPEEFKQLGWQIRRVMQTESGIPKRTELTKGELKIVVGVQRWQ